MSEKKTAEIKLRIEPSVKAQWQQSAADEGIGLSEFIVKCVAVHRSISEHQRRAESVTGGFIRTGYPLSHPAKAAEDRRSVKDALVEGSQIGYLKAMEKYGPTATQPVVLDPTASTFSTALNAPWVEDKLYPTPVPTSEGEKKFSTEWKPWEA